MNQKYTGLTVNVMRPTGMGSDYLGVCEVCGKHMSEAVFFEKNELYRHADGFLYLSAGSAGTYAHETCGFVRYGKNVVNKATLPKRGRLIEYPHPVKENA